MKDWKILLATKAFRSFWLALVCYDLSGWCVIAMLPVLIAEKFGAGSALVISLGIRILPRILLAPAAGALLRRAHPAAVAGGGMVVEGLLTALLPWCNELFVLQSVVFLIGVLDVFVMPALLTLRAPVTPRGLELAGNTLFFSADRLAKFAGPVIGGMAVIVGSSTAFIAFGAMAILAAAAVARLPAIEHARSPQTSERRSVVGDFGRMLLRDSVLSGLLICAVPYMITLGGMRPFLFWANAEWFGASDDAWTLLLAAQGVGAIVGALISGVCGRVLQRKMSVYELMLVTSLLEGMLHIALLGSTNSNVAIVLLILGGIPETLAYATYFTCVQERLPAHRQALFYALQQPLLDAAYFLGVISANLHAEGTLALSTWWALLSLFSTLPVLPLIALHLQRARVVPQARLSK